MVEILLPITSMNLGAAQTRRGESEWGFLRSTLDDLMDFYKSCWWRQCWKLVWGTKVCNGDLSLKCSLGKLRYSLYGWITVVLKAGEWQTDLSTVLITPWGRYEEDGGIWFRGKYKGVELLLMFCFLNWEVGVHILNIFSS